MIDNVQYEEQMRTRSITYKKRQVVIYGAGKNGMSIFNWLRSVGLEDVICAFCDQNYKEIKLKENVEILPYSALKNGDYVYIVTPVEKEEIVKRLEQDEQKYFCDFEVFVKNYFSNNKSAMDLISTEPFELNDNNEMLQEYYAMPNYKQVEYKNNSKICYIFFSSNGLYYPNEKGIFLKKVKAENRYEWEYIVEQSDIPHIATKCIYVRDIRKTWYATGINRDIDTIDKMIDFFKKITDGYEVITVGSSAGGYMAALMGAKLRAVRVFDFSGQFSLHNHENVIMSYYWLNKYKYDKKISKYYNILEEIKDTVPIIYFYPKKCVQDMKQAELVKKCTNVFCFAVDSDKHGVTLNSKELMRILTKAENDIQNQYKSILAE